MEDIIFSKTGFAVISAVILVAIAIYTVIKLRKQVDNREKEEKEKITNRLNKKPSENNVNKNKLE